MLQNKTMKLFTQTMLDDLAAKANASPRARANYNIHASQQDPVQRFFVVANRDSYFRPHRHLTKSELAMLVRGGVDILTFDEGGCVTARYSAGGGTPNLAYETPRATWHTLIAQTDGSAFFEVKEGPYDPATASEFASWAPPEGDASVPKYLAWLRTARVGDMSPAA